MGRLDGEMMSDSGKEVCDLPFDAESRKRPAALVAGGRSIFLVLWRILPRY